MFMSIDGISLAFKPFKRPNPAVPSTDFNSVFTAFGLPVASVVVRCATKSSTEKMLALSWINIGMPSTSGKAAAHGGLVQVSAAAATFSGARQIGQRSRLTAISGTRIMADDPRHSGQSGPTL